MPEQIIGDIESQIKNSPSYRHHEMMSILHDYQKMHTDLIYIPGYRDGDIESRIRDSPSCRHHKMMPFLHDYQKTHTDLMPEQTMIPSLELETHYHAIIIK
ncbi:hypothetical protein HNY73_007805 [Argiope bruennichi]|uniref:Uncharacterized protein n=1 Tax=Argiope bruennichi TaxID=94029 RepID=A0A8T0FHL4_ARGBR|nr:hypothetical protein HNY73_007805 [Argiope bruennichi]